MMDGLKLKLAGDWRTLLKFASIRLHLAAMAIGMLYAAMPALDPAIAAVLPAPLAAKAIGLYALGGAIVRAVKFRRSGAAGQ